MTLCEKCLHRDVCANRDCMDADDERAMGYCVDFMEIVRCKDCVKRGTWDCVKSKGYRPTTTKNNEFCCWGERKDT